MSKLKYSRLPTSDQTVEFSALDGPSYFSYGIDKKKYKSTFTYNNLTSAEPEQELEGVIYWPNFMTIKTIYAYLEI